MVSDKPALRFWANEHVVVCLKKASTISAPAAGFDAVRGALQVVTDCMASRPLAENELHCVTSNKYEHSIVLPGAIWRRDVLPKWSDELVREDGRVTVQSRWGFFRLDCPDDGLDFGIVGLLYRILAPLRAAGVSILAIGTYLTDYVLLSLDDMDTAVAALTAAGWPVFMNDRKVNE